MKACSITDIGKVRSVNQDYVFHSETAIGNLPNLFLVADGMGGHKAGDLASRYCVELMTEQVKKSSFRTPVSILQEAIQTANEGVQRKALTSMDYEGMGTTIVAATLLGDELYIANIGDSRAYLVGKEMKQITEDHSLVEVMVKNGGLERKDARSHPNKNIITRALGTNKIVQADFFELSVRAGDMILMCSDGLTNMIDDDELFEIIQNGKENLEVTVQKLIETANQYGGRDNISVILIRP